MVSLQEGGGCYTGALVSWMYAGGRGRIAASGQRFFNVTDHLGSVRAVVEGVTGSVVEARDYYAYGLEMAGRVWVSGQKAREGYTGHALDAETGWNYAGARYYAPALGRWMVVDPLAEKFAAHSPYNYVLGNPFALVDPDGREPIKPYSGTIRGFVSEISNNNSKMGRYSGQHATNHLKRMGETNFIEPANTGPFSQSANRYIYIYQGSRLDRYGPFHVLRRSPNAA